MFQRQASMTSTLKRILRDEIRHKRLQTVTPKTPQLLQIASINDPKGIGMPLKQLVSFLCPKFMTQIKHVCFGV